MSLIKNTTLIHAINLTNAQAQVTLLEPKRTGQGVHIVPVQYGTGTGSCIFAGPKTGPLLDRIDGTDSSFRRPIRTGTVWNSIRVAKPKDSDGC